MMKDKIEILKYDRIDSDFNSIIQLHQSISENSSLNKYLIYFDSNFPLYFKKIIEQSQSDLIYIIKTNNEISGFIHFKVLNDTIFLNNICLNDNNQGKGLGKIFLKKSLDLLPDADLKYFALDVFLSNDRALFWYQSLGLNIISKSNWQKMLNNSIKEYKPLDIAIILKKDINGFDSIFIKENKIATIVNKTTLLIHDLFQMEMIPLSTYENIITNQDTGNLNEKYEFLQLETSVRMKGSFKNVFDKLN